MKANKAIEKYGNIDELVKKVSDIAKEHGVLCCVEQNADDGGDFLNIAFEIPDKAWAEDFPKARNKVNQELIARGLQLTYVRGGDGNVGIIMSYRVTEF